LENSLPLPTLIFVAFGCGIAAAIAARIELRMTIRPVLLTNSFSVFLAFLILALVPTSIYFYIFHGDWFLLYLINVRRVPSALSLIVFLLEGGIGVLGFAIGAILARGQQHTIATVLIAGSIIASIAVIFVCPDRLAVVGNYAQYHGDFGLVAYRSSSVIKGSITMGFGLIAGVAFLITSLNYRGPRSS
jgi:hypothetical protein